MIIYLSVCFLFVKLINIFQWDVMEVMIESCSTDFILRCIFCMKRIWNGINNKKKLLCVIRNINYMKIQNTFLKAIQSNRGTAPLFVHCNLWQCVKGGGKSMYCIIENFCSQIFMDITWGWCCVGVYMCLWKYKINKIYLCSYSILSVIDSSCMLPCVAHKCHIIPAHYGRAKDVAIN